MDGPVGGLCVLLELADVYTIELVQVVERYVAVQLVVQLLDRAVILLSLRFGLRYPRRLWQVSVSVGVCIFCDGYLIAEGDLVVAEGDLVVVEGLVEEF